MNSSGLVAWFGRRGIYYGWVIFGMLGVMRAVGGLIWGPLSDRIGRSTVVVIICAISVVGLVLL